MRCVRVCAQACVLTSLKPTPRKRWPAFEARNRNPHSCSVGSCYPPATNSPATRAVDSLNVIALELLDCRECSGGTNALCVIPTVSMKIVSQSVGCRECSGGTNALCVIPTVLMEIVSQSVGCRECSGGTNALCVIPTVSMKIAIPLVYLVAFVLAICFPCRKHHAHSKRLRASQGIRSCGLLATCFP
jgi:hypothetical protein